MLSILIPIYNHDVRDLVQALHTQCLKAKIYFEIVCFDDHSEGLFRDKNRPIGGLINVSYIELSENKGRAKIRNLLGKNARYEKLLFLDCDSKIISKKFIKNYLKIVQHHEVIVGGRIYTQSKPKSQSKILHWTYGKKRESANMKRREKYPYLLFHSNNFVISRDLFIKVKFNESIKQYGYEDLLFAQRIKENDIHIRHIHNQIKHGTLEKTEVFLDKINLSIQNLVTLYRQEKNLSTPIITAYEWLEKYHLIGFFEKVYTVLSKRINISLSSSRPNMYLLDILKLNIFINKIRLLQK